MGALLLAVAATGLLSGPLQDPAQRGPGPAPTGCEQSPAVQGRQGEPVCPGPAQPIPVPYPVVGRITPRPLSTGPIKASTGDEAGVMRREIAPGTGPAPAEPDSALTGRPVGQPAAAGLGTHVQRGPATPREEPAPPPRSPN